ncbi:hypothetical protein GDO81_023364 [Engystomops pustulosus]|uniref:Uncharacterized protein n=1 Tax=Engystomops pustulosus TaxID=76066 RepID=A0AAV6YWD4_ENGPU|nr:hypothetical protein GDO81_023364 [Engystomops pustulosus]
MSAGAAHTLAMCNTLADARRRSACEYVPQHVTTAHRGHCSGRSCLARQELSVLYDARSVVQSLVLHSVQCKLRGNWRSSHHLTKGR